MKQGIYIVVSKTEIVKAEMERPEFSAWEMISPAVDKVSIINGFVEHCLSLPRIPIQGKHNWKVWQEVVEGKDFTFSWFVKTKSYQGEGGGLFDTEKEAENKYGEWSKYDGQLQCHTEKPVMQAVPIPSKQTKTINMKFRKKPVVIEAIQYTGKNGWQIREWSCNHAIESPVLEPLHDGDTGEYMQIRTLEGEMTASVGDWIIKGVNGEFYPCKPDIFEKTYEPAD